MKLLRLGRLCAAMRIGSIVRRPGSALAAILLLLCLVPVPAGVAMAQMPPAGMTAPAPAAAPAPATAKPAITDIILEKAAAGPAAAVSSGQIELQRLKLQEQSLRLQDYYYKMISGAALTVIVILFGSLVMAIISWTVGRRAKADQYLRSYIVMLIIISALILIVAGYSNDQIAPAFGLFGTIIGYMLGRLNSETGAPDPDPGARRPPAAPPPAPPASPAVAPPPVPGPVPGSTPSPPPAAPPAASGQPASGS